MRDYTLPIARTGEHQYACIMRNRSGMDSGEIDFGLRDVTHLSDYDQQSIVDTAYALYESICDQVGKKSKRDKND